MLVLQSWFARYVLLRGAVLLPSSRDRVERCPGEGAHRMAETHRSVLTSTMFNSDCRKR